MKSSAFSALLFGFCVVVQQPGVAQPPIDQKATSTPAEATNQPSASADENEVVDWLYENNKTADHLVALGVDRKVADAFVAEDNNGMLFPKWAFARTGLKSRVGVLFLPCNWADSAYLYLVPYNAGAWRITDQQELDCHYDNSASVEVVQVRDPNRDEILIHHACNGHGTGYLEQSFTVFLPTQGKLKAELETDEILHSFPTAVKVRHDLDQKSTFMVIPVSNSDSRAIEETRSSTLNDHLTVQRRIFLWDQTKGRYRPSPFAPVEAAPTK